MKLYLAPPAETLPGLGKRGWSMLSSNHGHVVRSRKGKHQPKSPRPPKVKIMVGGQTWAKWRRSWHGFMATIWRTLLTPTEINWWKAQAALVEFINYKNEPTTATGFEFFMWYQFRCFDLHVDRYIPFPTNGVDFPFVYTPPWDPPTLEPPTVLSAHSNGQVIVRCLNITPDDLSLLPWSCFMKYPPVRSNVSIAHPEWTPARSTVRHPWYWSTKSDDGDYSEYFYHLDTIFPKIKPGTRAALMHCYAHPAAEPGEAGPLYPASGVDGGGPDTPWDYPENICALDTKYAGLYTPDVQIFSNQLIGTDFNFTIPTDDTVCGIRLRIYPWTSNTTVWDDTVHLLKASVSHGENKGTHTYWLPLSSYPHVYGGSTDLWDAEWLPEDINDPGFGAFHIVRLGPGYTAALVNAFQITVWHVTPFGWFTETTQTNFTFD